VPRTAPRMASCGGYAVYLRLRSFPTRRSSDLHSGHVKQVSIFCIPSGTMGTIPSEVSMRFGFRGYSHVVTAESESHADFAGNRPDRKSTRLNSSHVKNSYAVYCLKKKNFQVDH